MRKGCEGRLAELMRAEEHQDGVTGVLKENSGSMAQSLYSLHS